MAKLEEATVRDIRQQIRSLTREAAIQVLLGVLNWMERAVSLRSVDFPEFIKDGLKWTEAQNGSGH